MEKEIFGAHPHLGWHSTAEAVMSEMESVLSDHLPHPGFLSMGWDHQQQHSIEQQGSQFESAYSSIVSSPSNPTPTQLAESAVIHELIGRLGSICNSGEISPQSHHWGNGSTNTSCYSTPLNSPPKLNLSLMEQFHQARAAGLSVQGSLLPLQPPTHMTPLPTDPGFAERAARFTSLGGRSYAAGIQPQFPVAEPGKLSRASSSKSLRSGSQMTVQENSILSRSSTPTPDEGREESSISGQVVAGGEAITPNARKRKSAHRGKGKEGAVTPIAKDLPKVAEEEDVTAKKTKSSEEASARKGEVKPKVEQSDSGSSGDEKQGKENNSKTPEPPKQDYIHVRARRGQATDSHSLAERVRREKISERMKFLQNLVPGCNKVTGKAVMLDEIINYVQSLQRQVEFLSMKLATVNPRLDFNMENILHKDMQQPHSSLPHSSFPVDVQAPTLPFPQQTPHGGAPSLHSMMSNGMDTHCPVNPLTATLGRTISTLDGIVADPQMEAFWGDDLHSVLQMGFVQEQEAAFSSQPLPGALHMPNMKIGL